MHPTKSPSRGSFDIPPSHPSHPHLTPMPMRPSMSAQRPPIAAKQILDLAFRRPRQPLQLQGLVTNFQFLHDFHDGHDNDNLKTFTTFSQQNWSWAVQEQYRYDRDKEELDLRMGGVGNSQPRGMVNRRITTAVLLRCGQKHLHREDRLQEIRSLTRRQRSYIQIPQKGKERKRKGQKPIHKEIK